MRTITFDLETRNFFQDVGSNDPADLDISVVCIHDSLDDSFKSFTQSNIGKLWPILEQADIIVSWNGEHFDIPILNKYYSGDLKKIKSIDLLKEVQKVLGRRLKLDTVGLATLGRKKSGHGSQAVEWWHQGEIEKIITYCIEDVRLTRDLYNYARINNHLKYIDLGVIKEIKIDTLNWSIPESTSMPLTLPF
ncbi:MAG: hypothetical protein A3B11_01410 [Candidatus Taylorbacteria bacterium RIFCSPLOWO2_01_FULL_44_26]|uniref:YprB ribonuclease H-like domain-containing protein n=2 Tax=Candidatus Tayloriibacteriota TaxID=1817919 RepID=A0A1G2MJU2_9BACT|nr:MAG: hypothetical protein A3D50_01190 [Candidatus Taylorbacteria bacterium RIFCSPHIGHO2_02_FULL_44_12]OHA30972.1 MAG: hypothetical protein A3B11_01410 [Candidatus Taylorbacteria bacterium RIFCSPLOWO2_01_FULL_44_26]